MMAATEKSRPFLQFVVFCMCKDDTEFEVFACRLNETSDCLPVKTFSSVTDTRSIGIQFNIPHAIHIIIIVIIIIYSKGNKQITAHLHF
jgi:hypothetical protein